MTAISHDQYDFNITGSIQATKQHLIGPGQTVITTVGYINAAIAWQGTKIHETVVNIKGLKEVLLSRPAIESLDILQRPLKLVETCKKATDVSDLLAPYPKLISRLGLMKTEYCIKVKNDAKP